CSCAVERIIRREDHGQTRSDERCRVSAGGAGVPAYEAATNISRLESVVGARAARLSPQFTRPIAMAVVAPRYRVWDAPFARRCPALSATTRRLRASSCL